MDITSCRDRESLDVTDFLVKRYADIDVDTGVDAGWAGFAARWTRTGTRCSPTTRRRARGGGPVRPRREHRGHAQRPAARRCVRGPSRCESVHAFRDNPEALAPLPTERTDAAGVLQWRASRFRASETLRIAMYDDTSGPSPADRHASTPGAPCPPCPSWPADRHERSRHEGRSVIDIPPPDQRMIVPGCQPS